MNIVVTGGAGFIGSHLTDRLLQLGHSVTVIDNRQDISNLDKAGESKDLEIMSADVSEPMDFKRTNPANVELVYHLACFPRQGCIDNPIRDLEVNTLSTLRVLQTFPNAKIVFSSNSGIYSTESLPISETTGDDPKLPYDLDKKTSEDHLKMWRRLTGRRFTIFRFPTVYGPRQQTSPDWKPVIAEFCNGMKFGRQLTIWGDGTSTRDFCYVSDIVKALVAVHSKETDGVTLLLGTDTETSVMQLFNTIKKKTGSNMEPKFEPEKPGEIKRMRYDYGRAKKMLDWEPSVTLSEGLDKVLASL